MRKFITSTELKKGFKGPVSKVSAVSPPEDTGQARTLKFTISTGLPDRDQDVIDQTGIDLTNYLKNPVVLAFHNSDTWPVGKCVSIGLVDGNLTATVEFVPFDTPISGPIAECAYSLCKSGFLNATSIGFLPTDWEWSAEREGGADFSKTELLEFSIVPIPCNADALIIPANEESEASEVTAGKSISAESINNRNARIRRAWILANLN